MVIEVYHPMELITSLQNERVKLANALQHRARARRKHVKIAVEGDRLLKDALDRRQRPDYVLYTPDANPPLLALLNKMRVPVFAVTEEVMAHVSATEEPQGMVGVFPIPMPPLPQNPRRVLVMDELGDPGNVGGLLRSAAAAGVEVAILSPHCADPYNPKALRSGMGAHFRLPVVEADWGQIAGYLDGLTVRAADAAGPHAYDLTDWTGRWALIVGSEAHGLGEKARQLATELVSIPMAAQTESLNAMAAAAVILFEAARQVRHRTG
jgi:TrmH family RNA methyltransferase